MSYEYPFPRPAVTVDTVVFTIQNQDLKILLIQRRDPPFALAWALPGGFVDVRDDGDQGESVDDAAWRELAEEAGIRREDVFLEQLYTFGTPGRDPRGRTITVAYFALVRPDVPVRGGTDAMQARWFSMTELPELAFDHDHIIEVAQARIRGKLNYEPRIAESLVPAEFTQADFRHVHEAVMGVSYDKSNFAKRFRRLLADDKLTVAPGKRGGVGRPAKIYRFTHPRR